MGCGWVVRGWRDVLVDVDVVAAGVVVVEERGYKLVRWDDDIRQDKPSLCPFHNA